MKIFDIDVAASGSYWDQYVYGMGYEEVEIECNQEATFTVASDTLDDALKLIEKEFDEHDHSWSFDRRQFFYDPETVEEREDEDGGDAEILDYSYKEPTNGYECHKRYSKEF